MKVHLLLEFPFACYLLFFAGHSFISFPPILFLLLFIELNTRNTRCVGMCGKEKERKHGGHWGKEWKLWASLGMKKFVTSTQLKTNQIRWPKMEQKSVPHTQMAGKTFTREQKFRSLFPSSILFFPLLFLYISSLVHCLCVCLSNWKLETRFAVCTLFPIMKHLSAFLCVYLFCFRSSLTSNRWSFYLYCSLYVAETIVSFTFSHSYFTVEQIFLFFSFSFSMHAIHQLSVHVFVSVVDVLFFSGSCSHAKNQWRLGRLQLKAICLPSLPLCVSMNPSFYMYVCVWKS